MVCFKRFCRQLAGSRKLKNGFAVLCHKLTSTQRYRLTDVLITTTTSAIEFTKGCQFDTLDFDLVVEGLRYNPHVLKLVIPGSIPELGLRYLADMLEENLTLTTVKVSGTTTASDEVMATIALHLWRNRALARCRELPTAAVPLADDNDNKENLTPVALAADRQSGRFSMNPLFDAEAGAESSNDHDARVPQSERSTGALTRRLQFVHSNSDRFSQSSSHRESNTVSYTRMEIGREVVMNVQEHRASAQAQAQAPQQSQPLQQSGQNFDGVRAGRDGLISRIGAAGSHVRRRIVHFETAAQLHQTRQQVRHARRCGTGSRRQAVHSLLQRPDHAEATTPAAPVMLDGSTQTATVPDTAQQTTHAVLDVAQHAAAMTSIRASLAMSREATASTRQLTAQLRWQSEAAFAQLQTHSMFSEEQPQLTVSDAVEQHAFAPPTSGAIVFAEPDSISEAIISGVIIASAAETILAKVSNSDSPDEDCYIPSQAAPTGSNTAPAEPASTSQTSTSGTGIAFSEHSKIDRAGNSNSSDEDRYIPNQAAPNGSSIAIAGNTELAEHIDCDASSSQPTSMHLAVHSAACPVSPEDHSAAAVEQVVDAFKEPEAVSTPVKANDKPKGRFARFRGFIKPIKGNRFL